MDESHRARSSIVGGAVCTRTARRSLRVNLLPPSGRLCGFDCAYCTFRPNEIPVRWPEAGDVGCAVAHALHSDAEVRSITVSGPGEPTGHPSFGRALAEVLSARRSRPDVAVRVVTNGETLAQPRVRRLLEFADERIVRLDAGGDRIARPRFGPSRAQIVDALRSLSDFSAESVFVAGFRGNLNEDDVQEWMALIDELGPKRVYVTTIASPPVSGGVRPAQRSSLESIGHELRRRSGIETEVIA